jgi:hypothetical protein
VSQATGAHPGRLRPRRSLSPRLRSPWPPPRCASPPGGSCP